MQIHWAAFLARIFGYFFAALRFSTLILLLIGLIASLAVGPFHSTRCGSKHADTHCTLQLGCVFPERQSSGHERSGTIAKRLREGTASCWQTVFW